MDAVARDERRMSFEVRAACAALATALRAGRASRREKLAVLGADSTIALPVWVGTLSDIDDLLPTHPALFDLVILDEASSIDQPHAATALLRGGRAVIVGDPGATAAYLPGRRRHRRAGRPNPPGGRASRSEFEA